VTNRANIIASSVLALGVLTSCTNENNINSRPINAIALVSGDFDHMGETLDRLLLGYATYEGYICCAAYDPDINPDSNGLKVETLFTGTINDGLGKELFLYDAVFLNSGARGWGAWEYNGLEPDDGLINDPDTMENIREFVDRGGRLVLSDWTYDLIVALWPDKIDFYGAEDELDTAQAGILAQINANVPDVGLAEALGDDTVSLAYNYSNWAVIESVAEDVTVHVSGDVTYRISASDGYGDLTNAPLLVSFPQGAGQVVFSTFHWMAQNPDMGERIMLEVVEGLDRGFTGAGE
jgi:hypothetical protein